MTRGEWKPFFVIAWCLNSLLPIVRCRALSWCCPRCVFFPTCLGVFKVKRLEVRAGWQDPRLRGQWPRREMKGVLVCTLAAQTGMQSSVKARLWIHLSSAPLPFPVFFHSSQRGMSVNPRVWTFFRPSLSLSKALVPFHKACEECNA